MDPACFCGDIHLYREEKAAPPLDREFGVSDPFWIVVAGGKSMTSLPNGGIQLSRCDRREVSRCRSLVLDSDRFIEDFLVVVAGVFLRVATVTVRRVK
jgi:hypothetical protein